MNLLYSLLTKAATLSAPTGLPQTDPTSDGTIQAVLAFVFGLTGAIALLFIAIAGFRYTISRGDSNTVKESKSTIIYAVIGLIVAISGYTIVGFVFGRLQ
jgi:hypothetical protein